jgi:WD40 repeat protein
VPVRVAPVKYTIRPADHQASEAWIPLQCQATNCNACPPEALGLVAISQDGCHLATGSQDRTVRIWDIPQVQHTLAEDPRQLLAEAERDTGLLPTDDALVPAPPAQFAARLKAIALRE